MMLYLQLFLSFLQIGAFSFGGGLAMLPLIEEQMVTIHGWLTAAEFADLVAVSEITPGPIAVDAAAFAGMRVGGIFGAVAATVGVVFPACVVLLIFVRYFFKYRDIPLMKNILTVVRPATITMIVLAGMNVLESVLFGETGFEWNAALVNWTMLALAVGAFLALRKWKVSPVLTMLACGAASGIFAAVSGL